MRRTELSAALVSCARASGVVLRPGASVRRHERTSSRIALELDGERIEAKLLVAADGLGSPRRRAEGLEGARSPAHARFGIRRHFHCAGPSDHVEVHLAAGVEAYLTPTGPERLGVAFLWEDGQILPRASFESLLERFPRIRELLSGAAFDSDARGAGPLDRRVSARVADRFVLLGDATGYVDAITGEGLSLAFAAAVTLGEVAPEALAGGGSARLLAPYARAYARRYRRYALVTRAMLALARRPALRRVAVGWIGRHERLLEKLVAFGLPD